MIDGHVHVVPGEAPVEEGPHGHLVGGVQDAWGSAACSPRVSGA